MRLSPFARFGGPSVPLLVLVLAGIGCAVAPAPAVPPASPSSVGVVPSRLEAPARLDDGWETATPEAVGLDEGRLAAMTHELESGHWGNFHAVLVARRGRLVYETYLEGTDRPLGGTPGRVDFNRDTLHDLRSVSKTVTATLVGIALDQGLIASVDTPVVDLLPEYRELRSGDKAKFTLRHALTMTGGFDWNEWGMPPTMANDEYALAASEDPLAFVFGKELVAPPGELFDYSGGMTHVLASVLERVTGEALTAYADRVLFTPLDIDHWDWVGIGRIPLSAYAGLRLSGRDVAKLGQLYLDGGTWQGRRIVSESWVREATARQVESTGEDSSAPDFVLSNGYGYQWWWNELETPCGVLPVYAAVGNGQQRVLVIPDLSLVVATLAGFYGQEDDLWAAEELMMEGVVADIGCEEPVVSQGGADRPSGSSPDGPVG